jgi:hypothetical protein
MFGFTCCPFPYSIVKRTLALEVENSLYRTPLTHPPHSQQLTTIMSGPQCSVCEGRGARWCHVCRGAAYCSPACREEDSLAHDLLCEDLARFAQSPRPSDNHVIGIFFPVDEPKPRLVWVRVERGLDPYGLEWQGVHVKDYLGFDMPPMTIKSPYPTNYPTLPQVVQVCYRDPEPGANLPWNQSVQAIIGDKPGRFHDWRGPIIFVRRHRRYGDMRTWEFRHAVGFLLSHNYRPVSWWPGVGDLAADYPIVFWSCALWLCEVCIPEPGGRNPVYHALDMALTVAVQIVVIYGIVALVRMALRRGRCLSGREAR